MAKKFKGPRAHSGKEKPEKRVAIKETEEGPSKAVKKNPAEPLKSALKKTVEPQAKNEVKITKDSKHEEEKSEKDQGLDDSVFLDGFDDEALLEVDSDDDSSDDDTDNQFKQSSEFDSKNLPASKLAPKAQNDKSTKQQKTEPTTGVIYLGRIPHGFYEEEMKAYFEQFGEVVRLRLSRSKKTGKTKHYGFIQFKHHPVAKIVADTLHNYLLCGNLLQCKLLDQSQIHAKLWVGAGVKFRKDCKIRLRRERRNQPKTAEQQEVISNRLIERERNKRKRLAELGIDYDFPGYLKPTKPESSQQARVVGQNKKSKKAKPDNKAVDSPNDKIRSEKSKKPSKKAISST